MTSDMSRWIGATIMTATRKITAARILPTWGGLVYSTDDGEAFLPWGQILHVAHSGDLAPERQMVPPSPFEKLPEPESDQDRRAEVAEWLKTDAERAKDLTADYSTPPDSSDD